MTITYDSITSPIKKLLAAMLLGILLLCGISCSTLLAEDDDLQQLEEQAIKAAVKRVAPSVVKIETVGGLDSVGRVLIGTGPTTGLIVSEDGYIVSSSFNFIQKPSSILIVLPGGKRAVAKLVATDHNRKIVLLKVKSSKKLPVPAFAKKESIQVGQWSMAVGRTFTGNTPNTSVGIVSAKNRIWDKAIQTDAKISPSNYGGPLINIHGQVMGLLVPLSPQSTGETAGAEWYDSGIGFAIDTGHIMKKLPDMKKGKNLYTGILGITLIKGGIYSQPAKISACRPNTPAQKIGLKAGDTIIKIDDAPIRRQSELRHKLLSRYAGETLQIVVARGKQNITFKVQLVKEVAPYEHPLVGILPMRNSNSSVVVRYIYPDSPAAKAGIKIGEQVTHIDGKEIENLSTIYEILGSKEPGKTISIKLKNNNNSRVVKLTLGKFPTKVPADLPPARTTTHTAEEDRPQVGTFQIKIPEFKNNCTVYVPDQYHSKVSQGVLVWLHGSKVEADKKIIQRWKMYCDRNDLILVIPKAAQKSGWQRGELEFITKCLNDIAANYNTDPNRIVTAGHQTGGTLAYLLANSNRDLIRGVGAIDSPLPTRLPWKDNTPTNRIEIYTTVIVAQGTAARPDDGVKRLQKMKYPVVLTPRLKSTPNLSGQIFSAKERALFVRWIDSLNKF